LESDNAFKVIILMFMEIFFNVRFSTVANCEVKFSAKSIQAYHYFMWSRFYIAFIKLKFTTDQTLNKTLNELW
jgi:hypothetical protein